MDPVPDPLLLRKSGSAGDRTRDLCICSQKLWPPDHRGGLLLDIPRQIRGPWPSELCRRYSGMWRREVWIHFTTMLPALKMKAASWIKIDCVTSQGGKKNCNQNIPQILESQAYRSVLWQGIANRRHDMKNISVMYVLRLNIWTDRFSGNKKVMLLSVKSSYEINGMITPTWVVM